MFFVFKLKNLILIALAAALLVLALLLLSGGKRGEARETFSETTEQLLLVLDPGHGGDDGGAVTASGVPESGINWAIAQKTRALAAFCGLPVTLTREREEIDYPAEADTIAGRKVYDQRSRVERIESLPGAVLLSIHQNNYPDARPRGAQVLYAETAGSEAFGKLTHDNLVRCLFPENRRVAAPADRDIYLMRSVSCPAILVECGFLSHPEEAALLQTEDYQRKLAAVLIGSYCQFLQSL